jgi:hypothetical protein
MKDYNRYSLAKTLNPYQGLKQGLCQNNFSLGDLAKTLNPYQGLKPRQRHNCDANFHSCKNP